MSVEQCLLNEADDKGWPIYLETQERRSAHLYARLGFKMLQDGMEIAGWTVNLDDVASAAGRFFAWQLKVRDAIRPGCVVVLVALPASLLLGLDLAMPSAIAAMMWGERKARGASRRMCRSMAVLGLGMPSA